MVRKSASICVGCHSSVRPLYTGTPAYPASFSMSDCLFPRYSIPSYIRPKDPCSVGDRLLVAHLRAGRVEVGHVRALVVCRHLEPGPGAGGGLLEDEGDLLALEPLALRAGVLRDLERLRQLQQVAQLARFEVDLLQKTAIAQIESHVVSSFRMPDRARSGRSCSVIRRVRGRARTPRS